MKNLATKQNKKKLLLHVCCATCAGYPYYYLSENYKVTLFYYNPNIYPKEEYMKRLNDVKRFSKIASFDLIIGKYNDNDWKNYVLGLESEPEGGKRCKKCFIFRMRETANTAKLKDFDFFTTTMSVSPHKNFLLLNEIGKNFESYFKISYIESNFKKNEGFKKTLEISKKLNFYRQNYCGCKYSIKESSG
jgi:predicted adenine nucleotide alpha hydrolase (AANH) superfamily ATPase